MKTIVLVAPAHAIRIQDVLQDVPVSIIKRLTIISLNASAVPNHVRHARVLHNVSSVRWDTGEASVSITVPHVLVRVTKARGATLAVRLVIFKR